MPRADTDARAERDAWVLRLFLAGHTYREIGRNPRVSLSAKMVGNVVNRQLAGANPHHNTLGTTAAAIYVERLEALLRSAWPQAMKGDLKAIHAVLAVLRAEAKVHGLAPGRARYDDDLGELDLDEVALPPNGYERDATIAELRNQGYRLKDIGRRVGMTTSGVSRALDRIGDGGRPGRDARDT
jgi:hypothetical protein